MRVPSTPTRFRHSLYAVPVASLNSFSSNPGPRITRGVADLFPRVRAVSASGRPRALELRLHFLEPLLGLQGGSPLQSVPVSRLEILELPVLPIVGARDVCRSPVSDFDRRIQRLSGGVTGRSARHRSGDASDHGSDRPPDCGADRGPGGRSACRSQTGADGMRSGLARDWIPVGMDDGFEGVLRYVHFSISYPVSSACKDGAINPSYALSDGAVETGVSAQPSDPVHELKL